MEIEHLNVEIDNLQKRVDTLENENKRTLEKIQKISKEMLTVEKMNQELRRQAIQAGIR